MTLRWIFNNNRLASQVDVPKLDCLLSKTILSNSTINKSSLKNYYYYEPK
jgi:hypothetical protein